MTENLMTEEKIEMVCDNLKKFLLAKNERYGDSALDPLHIFSKEGKHNSICQRIDDKLSRIKNSDELRKNDVVDLAGYTVLLLCERLWLKFDDLID